MRYHMYMARRYRDPATEDIANGHPSKAARRQLPESLHHKAAVKIKFLRTMQTLSDLKNLGFGLHQLKGDRKGQWALKINDQYRICFLWDGNQAYEIEVGDYH